MKWIIQDVYNINCVLGILLEISIHLEVFKWNNSAAAAAAAAAKSLQSWPTLVRPHRRRPTRLPRPWDSPGKNTGVGCHFVLQCTKVKSESEVAQACGLFAAAWTAAYQAVPSMGVSRQEYWSGVPLPSPQTTLYPYKLSAIYFLQVTEYFILTIAMY